MTTVVVPFAGSRGKTRLDAPPEARRELSLAMLADVVAAATPIGRTLVVTPDADIDLAGVELVDDPGGGQGAAVQAALAGLEGDVLVVNADLPCVTTADLLALVDAIPPHGMALVEARDGTTNALGLSSSDLFQPLYGPGSAGRFRALGAVSVSIPNIAEDVDTSADLDRLRIAR